MKKPLIILLFFPLIGFGQSINKPTDWISYTPKANSTGLYQELCFYTKEKNFEGPSVSLTKIHTGGEISEIKELYIESVIPATAKLDNKNGIIRQSPKEIILNGERAFYFTIEWDYSSYVVRRTYYVIPFSEYTLQICFMDFTSDNCQEIFQRTLKTIKFH